MNDPTPQEIHADIARGLACAHLEVDGDGRHFFATIVSADFEGLTRVRRHQRVYAALGDKMREHIHALSMKTLTPAEWSALPEAERGLSAGPSPGRSQGGPAPSGGSERSELGGTGSAGASHHH